MGASLCAATGQATTATGTNYLPAGTNSGNDLDAAEANRQIPVRVAGTFSYLQVLADANGTSRSVTFRKNTAAGNLTVAPTDTTAGLYIDSTHSDTVAAGDVVAMQVAISTAASLLSSVAMIFTATSGHHALSACNLSAANFSAASVSRFSGIAGQSTSATITAESQVQNEVRVAGTVGNFYARISTNAKANATTINFRINSANGNNVLTVGAGLTGLFEDTGHTDTLASGDLINSQVTTLAGVNNFVVEEIGIGFTPTSGDTNDIHGLRSAGTARTAGAGQTFYPIAGRVAAAASEANAKIRHGFQVTLSRARIFVSANTYTGTATFLTRVNGANGAQSVAIGAGLTGWFEDTTNSETVNATDDVCFALQDGTANSLTFRATGLTETIPSTPFGWFAQLSEPRNGMAGIAAMSTARRAAGEFGAPAIQPSFDNANVRWHRPFSEPVRFLRDPRYVATLAASGSPPRPYNQPAADNANVRWHQPFSLPVRYIRDPRYGAAFAAGPVQAAVIQPSFDAANVRWFRPLSEPRRETRFVARIAAESSWPIAPSIVVAPTVTVDMWFQQWQQPVLRPRRPAGMTVDPINTTSPAVDGWFQPFSVPIRRDPRYAAALDRLQGTPYQPAPVVTVALDWLPPLALPVRYARDPRYTAAFSFYLAEVVLTSYRQRSRDRLLRRRPSAKPPHIWKGIT